MLQLSIRTKLFITIFLTCLLAVAAALGFFRFQFQRTYLDFVRNQEKQYLEQLQQTLADYYANTGTWDGLSSRRAWQRFQHQVDRQRDDDVQAIPPVRPPPGKPPRRDPIYDLRRRTVLLSPDKQFIQAIEFSSQKPDFTQPIELNGKIIGYVGLYKREGFADGGRDAKFIKQQNKSLLLIALATLGGSLVAAWWLSRQLVKPIRRLQDSTRELAEGNYATRIETVGTDELGQLSLDFNQLAQRLQQHEQARRRWIMDIAHELRTPLSVLRGEVEAIQDGISEPDEPTIHSLHQETLHLQRLVEDLYTLSLSDSGALSYHKTPINLIPVLLETLAQFEGSMAEQGLTLRIQGLKQKDIIVLADAQRLQQLFQNLLKNSLRYTDAPGLIRITVTLEAQQIILTFEDSAPGVPTEALPLLFDRLYRVDASRNRATGGAGIGLSICHTIVGAHDGRIHAEHSDLGGLKIVIRLPISS